MRKAPAVKRLSELQVRKVGSPVVWEGGPVRTPAQAAAIFRQILDGRVTESMVVLHLSSRHYPKGWEEVARGEANVVHVSMTGLFRGVLLSGASAILVAHNHPTGDPTPSEADAAITQRIKASAELLGVAFLDHVVLGEGRFYSFSDGRFFDFESLHAAPQAVAA